MTSIQPQVAPDGRYSVSETCGLLGIHRDSLRKYTTAGIIKCGYRRLGERLVKFYLGSEIVRFWNLQS